MLPDTFLPSQFFVTVRSPTPPKPPECRLLIAVLKDAVECFQKYLGTTSKGERRLFREAEQWIMGGNGQRDKRPDAQGLAFSFGYVCEALGIEPDYIRRGLRQWRDAQLAKSLRDLVREAPDRGATMVKEKAAGSDDGRGHNDSTIFRHVKDTGGMTG